MGRHKEWRKIAKKIMRKRKRTLKAVMQDSMIKEEEEKRAQSPSFKIWLKEQENLEIFHQEEEERVHLEQHNRWLQEEKLASERWIKHQKKLQRINVEKAKQEFIIREEWEQEQKKLKKQAEARKQEIEKKEREEAELFDRIEKYVIGESERLPSSARTMIETQPGFTECPFFVKVAACRFRDTCSRNHIRPSVSRTLLIPGFYTHFRMDHINQNNEYDTDVGLEYDDKEIYQHFLEFYNDVLSELKSYGKVLQFKVCCNEESHLRGNVYVQYSSERYAIKAFRALQGRYYGGKQITIEFCNIPSWSKALCGLFASKKCPKGTRCNFLHVFRNPNSEFRKADRDNATPINYKKEKTDWNWSPSPESIHRSIYHKETKCEESNSLKSEKNKHSLKLHHADLKSSRSRSTRINVSERKHSRSEDDSYLKKRKRRTSKKRRRSRSRSVHHESVINNKISKKTKEK